MINKLKYATITDIGITDIIFFNNTKNQELVGFCRQNGISYLPARNRETIYKLNEESFIETTLKEEFIVNPYDRIFDLETLQKFEKVDHNEIRFIVENGKIKGVVHIVDYNNEFLTVELYRAYFRFENFIRQILILNGKSNADLLSWLESKAAKDKPDGHWSRRYNQLLSNSSAMMELNPFQLFYLRELLVFARKNKLLNIGSDDLEMVCMFRNDIAHSKDVTSQNVDETGMVIYNFENLKNFVGKAQTFFRIYEDVEQQYQDLKHAVEVDQKGDR